MSHGEPCTRCKDGFYHVITEGCYRGSQWSAAVFAAEAYLHQWLRTYQGCIDLFLAPSEFVRDQLISRGFAGDRIAVLPHFQTLPSDDQLATDGRYLLYFGRLSAEKGLEDLVHAMARVPHIPLVIAGEGPERQRLEELARTLNLPGIKFAGHVNGKDLEKLIAGCTLSVFPSHAFETLGKSILESYAFARPVVASDRGSRREMVEDGITGLLYPPGDPAQLSQCVAFLFDHPDVAESMGQAARGRLQAKHDPEQHLLKLCSFYAELVRKQKTISIPRPSSRRSTFSRAPFLDADPPSRSVKVAFIGGRGLISKYSGIESYYEQVGRELALRGHEVTVYCRNYFTPAMPTHNGMRIRRLPTIRTKHMETLVHTFLSTLDAMNSECDVVHYHCLGPALFSFLPRMVGKKTVVTVQGLDWQRASGDASPPGFCAGAKPQPLLFPMQRWSFRERCNAIIGTGITARRSTCPMAPRALRFAPPNACANGNFFAPTTSSSSDGFRRRRTVIYCSKRSRESARIPSSYLPAVRAIPIPTFKGCDGTSLTEFAFCRGFRGAILKN